MRDWLRSLEVFRDLGDASLQALAGDFEEITLDTGGVLFEQGDDADALYIVRSGAVDVRVGATTVATLGEGRMVGERGALDGAPRTATVVAAEPSVVLRLRRDRLADHPGVASSLAASPPAPVAPNPSAASGSAPRDETRRWGELTIVQVSDLHVPAEGEMLHGIDTYRRASDAVDHVAALGPDVVFVTGDLVASGTREEYERVAGLLVRIECPVHVIPGNHDRRAPLLDVLSRYARTDENGFVQYVVEGYPMRLVGIDTLVEGQDHGELDDRRLRWLDRTLGAGPDRPTVVFMHHPPFETGVWWMDTLGLFGAGALREVLASNRQVLLVGCGHVHRPISTSVAGVRVAAAPAVAFAVALDLEPEAPPKALVEPPACLVHVYDGTEVVSHTSLIGSPGPVIDIAALMGDWDALKAQWRQRWSSLRAAREGNSSG